MGKYGSRWQPFPHRYTRWEGLILTNQLNVPSPSKEWSSPTSQNSSPYPMPGICGSMRTDCMNPDARPVSEPPPNIFLPIERSQNDEGEQSKHLLVPLIPVRSRSGNEARTRHQISVRHLYFRRRHVAWENQLFARFSDGHPPVKLLHQCPEPVLDATNHGKKQTK